VYCLKYPQLFLALSKYPNEKKYDAIPFFGPNGKEMLLKVRDWLEVPTTTYAMPLAAIAAVQRAADEPATGYHSKYTIYELSANCSAGWLYLPEAQSAFTAQAPLLTDPHSTCTVLNVHDLEIANDNRTLIRTFHTLRYTTIRAMIYFPTNILKLII